MRWTLLAAAFLLISPAVAAQDARPPPGSVWTVMNTVEATIHGNYAIVQVIADIANRGPDPEFPFLVRVPDDAFVTGLTIERDGKVYEARIEERAAAREEYEAWKAQEQTGGLVEKQRHSQVYAYLVNVAEFTNVRATLTYEQYLPADRGIHNLSVEAPVSGFGQDLGARFHVRVLGEDVTSAWGAPSAQVARSPAGYDVTYEVGPRASDASTPFQVGYALAPTSDAGDLRTMTRNGTGYFIHVFRAPPGERQMPVDLVLALDISGSMSGLKIQQMQDAAAQVIQQLGPEDRLHLAFFSSDASSPWSGLRPMTSDNRKAAADEVRNAFVAGGTNLEAALRSGFDALSGIDWREEEGRLPALVVLTDGQPTVGITDREQLRALARNANSRDINIFAIAFGSDADWSFIHGIAADGEGTALRVPEGAGAEVDIRRFMQALTTPVLKDVRIAYPEDARATRTSAPILFAGSELVVVGTYDASKGPLHAVVTARAPDGARSWNATSTPASDVAFVPRIVAYHEIRALQDLIGAEGESPGLVQQVVDLGVKHGFVTDHTSLVVTLDARPACADCAMPLMLGTMESSADSSGRAWSVTPSGWTGSANAPGAPPTAPTATTTATTRSFEPPSGASPTPKVPGPGLALVALGLLAAALVLRRR